MNLRALRQQALATALTPTRENSAPAFGLHARAKTVLAFSGAFGRLIGAFHSVSRRAAGTVEASIFLSTRVRSLRFNPRVATSLFCWNKTKVSNVIIEPATAEDLDELSDLLGELFSEESDFRPNKEKQLRGLRLIFEEPNRGRVFVLRRDHSIVGMINLLFTISTAEGGFVLLLEDLVIHKAYRDHGYGSQLLEYAIDFARKKKFLRITLLTDRPEIKSQAFFKRHGFFESAMIPMRLLITPENPPSATL
jgi:GNAT superfamily N-acetyltransferase